MSRSLPGAGGGGQVHYVAAGSINPVAPYTNWATAAITVQDAVDVAAAGSEIVVDNGVYATGGRTVNNQLTNRAIITVHPTN